MQSNGFIRQNIAGIDTSFAFLAHVVPEILLCMVFKLSFGGHLEKRPLVANVFTFERDIGAHVFLNWSRYSNPPSNKGRKKMVTGPQDMALLAYYQPAVCTILTVVYLPSATRCIQDVSTIFAFQQFHDPLLILTRASLSASNIGLPNTRCVAVSVLVWNAFCCYSKRASTVNTVYHNFSSET